MLRHLAFYQQNQKDKKMLITCASQNATVATSLRMGISTEQSRPSKRATNGRVIFESESFFLSLQKNSGYFDLLQIQKRYEGKFQFLQRKVVFVI